MHRVRVSHLLKAFCIKMGVPEPCFKNGPKEWTSNSGFFSFLAFSWGGGVGFGFGFGVPSGWPSGRDPEIQGDQLLGCHEKEHGPKRGKLKGRKVDSLRTSESWSSPCLPKVPNES